MLCLGEKIRRHHLGVAAAVGQHQDFAGACDHVNGYQAKDLALGLCHKGIAGSHDLIHLGKCFRAIGQRSHRLGAAHLEDAIHPGDLRRSQNGGGDFSVLSRRRGDDDFPASGNLGGNGVHEHRGGVGSRAAGHIKPHLFNRHDFLPHDHAGAVGEDKAGAHLLAVEGADVLGRHAENLQKGGIHRLHGLFLFCLAHLQGGERHVVEFLTVVIEGFVSLGADGCENLPHHRRHVHLGIRPGKDLLWGNFL